MIILRGTKKMIEEVSPSELIEAAAKELAKVIEKPEWADFVKTGVHKERPPVKDDWWHMRAASILRATYIKGPIGVSKLRTKYGGRKNCGYKPEHFRKGSGKIIRTILQQLEKEGLIKQGTKGVHKGRIITQKGKKLLKDAAANIYKVQPKKTAPERPAVTEAKKEETPKTSKPLKQDNEKQKIKMETEKMPVAAQSAEKTDKKEPGSESK